MTRAHAWVVGLGCWALTGCGAVTVSGDSGQEAGRGDSGADVGADLPGKETTAEVRATDAPNADRPDALDAQDAADVKDAKDAKEVGFPDAPTCPAESDHGALVPSTACTVASPATADATCPGSATCPVSTMFQLTCKGSGYGPWLVPTTGGGAVMFVSNTGSFTTRLFTLGPGSTARVEDVPGLTSAANALAADTDGNPTIFAGEMPGIWRVRKTSLGWKREIALETGGPLALVTDGRARDATKAAVAFWTLDDEAPRLATRDGSCWRTEVLPGSRSTFMGMDLDATNRAWVAWFGYQGMTTVVQLAGPDGLHEVWSTPTNSGLSLHDRPLVLANGLTGTGAFPALAIQRADAVHVLAPAPAAPSWSDRPIPGSAMAVRGGNCPAEGIPGPSGCNGLTTCTSTTKGALGGYGIARTTTGRTYAAWLAGEGESTYSLMQSGGIGFCPVAPPPAGPAAEAAPPAGAPVAPPTCLCSRTLTSSRGSVTVIVARVDTPTPVEALRVQIDVGAEPRARGLQMTARGNTLLIVASNTVGADTRLRYLELDTTKLP